MAVNVDVFTTNKMAVTLRDGTGTPVTLTLANETSVTIAGLTGRKLNALTKIERRGKFVVAAAAERVYPQVTIEYLHTGWKGITAVPGTPLEFATFQGLYVGNVSTRGGGTQSEKHIDIGLASEGTDYGDQDGALLLEDCLLVSHTLLAEGTPSTYQMVFDVCGAISGDLAYAED
jgi:hypothetical protein